MARTRSEYVLSGLASALPPVIDLPEGVVARPVATTDRESAATLLLDAYRRTIDDEGEGPDEALAVIDQYFATILWPPSVVLLRDRKLVAMAFVVVVRDRHYIDPVTTAPSCQGRGLGRAAVLLALRSLADVGVDDVGATITDGNTSSERLFTGLGFTRIGTW